MFSVSGTLLSTFSFLFFRIIHGTYSRGHLCTYQFGTRRYPGRGLVSFSPYSNSIFKFSLAPIILHSPFSFILCLAALLPCHKKDPAGKHLSKDTLGPPPPHVRIPEVKIWWWSTCIWKEEEFSHWFWYHQTSNLRTSLQDFTYCWNFHWKLLKGWMDITICFLLRLLSKVMSDIS